MARKNVRKVLVITGPSREDWQEREVNLSSLRDLQTIIGGYIEHYDVAPGIEVYIDEEGRLKDLPPTVVTNEGALFVGPVIVYGRKVYEGGVKAVEQVMMPVRSGECRGRRVI